MRIFCITMFSVFFSQAAPAQRHKQLLDRIDLLHRSIFITKNPDSLKALLAKELIYGHTDGHAESRDALLGRIDPDKGATYSQFNAQTTHFSFANRKTAIVRQEITARVNVDGQVSRLEISLLMVWVRHKGEWLLELRQAVKRE